MEATNSNLENEPSTSSASLYKTRRLSQECSQTKIMKIEEYTQKTRQNNFEEIQKLHKSIFFDDVANVEKFIHKNPNEFYASSDGESAMATTLKLIRPAIYELLIVNGFRLEDHEDFNEIMKKDCVDLHQNVTENKEKIFEIHRKCAVESNHEHLMKIRSICRLHHTTPKELRCEHFWTILTALKELDKITEVSLILEIIALCPKLRIIFDFSRASVDHIDPKKNENVLGSTHSSAFCITIGAQLLLDKNERFEVYGTMAHEFCHYAMNLMFANDCKPYAKDDKGTEKTFEEVVTDYSQKKITEEIVVFAFQNSVAKWHAELIVRVPHLLAFYKGVDDKLYELRNNFSELFEFYEKLIPVMKKKINEMKVELAVKEINEICGVTSELRMSVFHFKNDAVKSFKIDLESKIPQVYESNSVELTIQTIREKAMKEKKMFSLIFAKMENFKTEKIAKQIFSALERFDKVSVIIDCDEFEEKEFKSLDEILKQTAKNQKIVFVSNEKLKISAIKCQKANHSWPELTEESQKKLLDIKVNFQGTKLKFYEIWSKNFELVKSVPLNELSKGKEIKIGEEIKFEEVHVERQFFAMTGVYKRLAVDEIIKAMDNSKIFVLSDSAGNGKSIEFKFLTFKLKEKFENFWILLIDLKMHTKSFENDSKNSINFDSVEKITEFLADKILKLKNFEKDVFSELFKNDRVVVLMDGVDEISPSYKKFVINLASGIRKMTENQLWMATRPHLAKELEEKLETTSWKLTEFSKKDQMSFFEMTFKKRELKCLEHYEKIEKFLGDIENRERIVKDENEEITSPLLLYMIAELFVDNPIVQHQDLNLYKIYNNFVKKMFRRLLSKGSEAENDLVNFMRCINIQEFSRKIAVEQKLGWLKLNHLFKNLPKPSDDQLTRVGLMYDIGDGRFFFIHETFREFFIAQTIFEKLFKLKFNTQEEMNQAVGILYEVIEYDDNNYAVIRKFLDAALENLKIDEKCDKSKILIGSLDYKKFDFNNAAERGRNNLLITLSRLIADNQRVMEIWMKRDYKDENVLVNAFKYQTLEKVQKILIFADEFFTEYQIKNLIISKDKSDDPNCFTTAISNKDERTFDFLLSLTEKKLNSSEKEELINCKSLHTNYVCIKDVKIVSRRIKKLLPHQYEDFLRYLKDELFYWACENQNNESFKFFCEEIVENFDLAELKLILQKTDEDGRNVLMYAACNEESTETFETLINLIEAENKIREMLEQNDEGGNNVLMQTPSLFGRTEINRNVLEAYRKYFKIEELNRIFMRENIENKNVFDKNAEKNFKSFEMIWSFMQELFDDETLRKMLIKSLKYVNINYLCGIMPWILQTLTVDEYPLILAKWFEAVKELGSYDCKELFASVDSHDKVADLFYKKLFEYRDENNEMIFDCATQNKYNNSEEIFELFSEKKNKLYKVNE